MHYSKEKCIFKITQFEKPTYLLIFQDIYSGMRDNYYRSGDGFLLVYSVDVPESTKDVEERFHGIIRARVI